MNGAPHDEESSPPVAGSDEPRQQDHPGAQPANDHEPVGIRDGARLRASSAIRARDKCPHPPTSDGSIADGGTEGSGSGSTRSIAADAIGRYGQRNGVPRDVRLNGGPMGDVRQKPSSYGAEEELGTAGPAPRLGNGVVPRPPPGPGARSQGPPQRPAHGEQEDGVLH